MAPLVSDEFIRMTQSLDRSRFELFDSCTDDDRLAWWRTRTPQERL